MATYTHQCRKCGTLFEHIRPMSQADQKVRCPHCKSKLVRKLISAPTVIYGDDDFTKKVQPTDGE